MDPSSIKQLIILLLLLILSAFFSSAETALTTVNKHRMRALAEKRDPRARRVLKLIENPDKMLSAILIGNNIVNLSASSLTTTFAMHMAQAAGFGSNTSTFVGIATGILTFVILIAGEIAPKTIATKKNETMSLLYSGPISILTSLLTPVILVVNSLSRIISNLAGASGSDDQGMTEMELRTIVDVSEEDGVIEQEEKTMINNVFDFGDSIAKDIMLPRIHMTFAAEDMSYDEIVDIFIEEQYSRLPVYKESRDHVIGILNLKDLFFFRESHRHEPFDIHKIMRKPYFTFEYQKTSVLMEQMRKNSVSFAIVLDEYGSVAGLVTLEDLIEEIIGEIRDEFDDDEKEAIKKLGDREYIVSGAMKLDDINDQIGTDIESEDYDSIGGHMIELLDHLPEKGETVREGCYLFSVKEVEQNRIKSVYIRIDAAQDEE